MKKRTRHPNHHNNGNRNQQVTVSPNSVVISKEEHQRLLASDKTANRIASMHAFNTKFGQDGLFKRRRSPWGLFPAFFLRKLCSVEPDQISGETDIDLPGKLACQEDY